jgi:hypothetical protein
LKNTPKVYPKLFKGRTAIPNFKALIGKLVCTFEPQRGEETSTGFTLNGINMDQAEEFFYNFWTGRNGGLLKYWSAYKLGEGYQEKFSSMKSHVLEITFENTPKELPLYNLEPIYKTIKSYYHDIKKDCLTKAVYNLAGPLFIYEINRGSGIWTWLGELYYVLILGTSLTEEKIKGQRIDNIEKKLRILKEYFGDSNVRSGLFQAFVQADTPQEMEQAMQNLFEEKIKSVKISKSPIITTIDEAKKEMIDLNIILKQLKSNH